MWPRPGTTLNITATASLAWPSTVSSFPSRGIIRGGRLRVCVGASVYSQFQSESFRDVRLRLG